MHVHDPAVVLGRMGGAVRPGGWVVAQEPITSAGRVGGRPLSMPDARHPDVGADLPALARAAGLEVVDAWAESQAGAGPGPVADYLARLTGVHPGDDAVVLPAAGHRRGPPPARTDAGPASRAAAAAAILPGLVPGDAGPGRAADRTATGRRR